MNHFLDWHDFQGASSEKFFKNTLWNGEHVMVGLNCLEPNQQQPLHAHSGADKFYYVLSGKGRFTIGDEERTVESGTVVLAPANIPHGVTNSGEERLSLLVAISPGINK
jgi:quercetin dioxygenase-like cupin family protein